MIDTLHGLPIDVRALPATETLPARLVGQYGKHRIVVSRDSVPGETDAEIYIHVARLVADHVGVRGTLHGAWTSDGAAFVVRP